MSQMMKAIETKSDQINADDLIGTDMVVTVKKVAIVSGDQPVQISLAETEKFFRPCKSMSRVLVALWGPDPDAYVGRSMRLYRDPEVKWGGMKVGGIRISEVSHIGEAVTMPLTEKRGLKKMVTIRPLSTEKLNPEVEKGRAAALTAALGGKAAFTAWWNSAEGKDYRATGDDILAELQRTVSQVEEANGPSALERRLRAPNEPTETEIERSQELIGAVLGEPEFDIDQAFPGDKAWVAGEIAAIERKPESANPHRENPNFSTWLAGYRQKAAEIARGAEG